jgi:hypothetical protein
VLPQVAEVITIGTPLGLDAYRLPIERDLATAERVNANLHRQLEAADREIVALRSARDVAVRACVRRL